MNRLTEIANKYNTDKGTNPMCDTGWKGHGFTEFYYRFFKDIKHPVILEIGVWKGSSIKTFNEFYNGDCEIHCIDINQTFNCEDIGENIHFHLLDCGKADQLDSFVREMEAEGMKFDFILDDASHIIYQQMLTYSKFRKLLKPNGMYVMEDLHCNFGDCWDYNREEKSTTLDFFVNFKPYWKFDDSLNNELLREIKTVELFSNDDAFSDNIRLNRSITAIIRLK